MPFVKPLLWGLRYVTELRAPTEACQRMKRLGITLFAFALVTFALSAQAGTITEVALDDCDAAGCEGSGLFLSVEDEGGTWLVTYTIDTDGYTGNRDGFNQIGFLAIKDWTSVALVSADPDLASWSDPIEAPVNSNSLCSNTNGDSDKVCIYGFVDITGGGEYTWQFRVTGGTLLETTDWHLGGQYANNANATSGKIISADVGALVPEPSAALLFGVGVLVLNRARRRD